MLSPIGASHRDCVIGAAVRMVAEPEHDFDNLSNICSQWAL